MTCTEKQKPHRKIIYFVCSGIVKLNWCKSFFAWYYWAWDNSYIMWSNLAVDFFLTAKILRVFFLFKFKHDLFTWISKLVSSTIENTNWMTNKIWKYAVLAHEHRNKNRKLKIVSTFGLCGGVLFCILSL